MKFRRLLCLLLLLPVVLISVLAAPTTTGKGDAGGGLNMSGAGLTYANGREVGLAIGIQVMDDKPGYKVVAKTADTEDQFKDDKVVNNLGLANVCEHFLYSYPNPYNGDVFYLLPNSIYNYTTPTWRTTTVEGRIGRASMLGRYAVKKDQNPDSKAGHDLSDAIYDKMVKGEADDAYFKSLIVGENSVSYDTAFSYICYIFGPATTVYYEGTNYATPDVDKINERWLAEYGYGTGAMEVGSTEYTKRQLANYTAILTCLSKLLSASVSDISNSANKNSVKTHYDYNNAGVKVEVGTQVFDSSNATKYAEYIATFATAALNGEAYSPIVITAETCIDYRTEQTYYSYSYWRTSSEHLALQARVAESSIRKADSDPLYVNSINGRSNMTLAILEAACKQSNYSGNSYSCSGFLGTKENGNRSDASGTWGRGMTSLSESVINSLAKDWGISVPGGSASTAALWGCGIFGGTEALTVVFLFFQERTKKQGGCSLRNSLLLI